MSASTDTAAERQQEIIEAIAEAETSIAYHIDVALDALVYLGCFSQRWGSSVARNELCKAAAREAIRRVIADASVPAEARWLAERAQ